MHKKLTISFLLLTSFILPQISHAAVGPNWIEQWGITWTFDKNISTDGAAGTYQYGTFANGDYWIKGPVNIVKITPESVDIGGRTMNGSMVNPAPTNGRQGYDSGMTVNDYDSTLNKALNVSASNLLALSSGSSLVSTISIPAAGSRPQLKTASVLTVLSDTPATESFRPPYSGTDKIIKYNKGQLNYSVLKNLAPVANTPNLTDIEREFQRVYLDHKIGWTSRYQHPTDNMKDYGRDISTSIANAALMLNLNFTNTQKEKLLINLVQVGIDFYGVAQAGGFWPADGGQSMGRLLPIQLAGLVLGDTNMLNAALMTNPKVTVSVHHSPQLPKVIFQELQNTFYVNNLSVSITQNNTPIAWKPDSRDVANGAIDPYTEVDVANRLPEYGIRHLEQPQADNRNFVATSSYRSINGAASAGHALAALIMGLKPYWNHDVFFDYHDRWFSITDGYQMYQSMGAFAKNMWKTYRANYGPVWTEATVQPLKPTILFGDVNNDGTVTLADATMLAQSVVGATPLNTDQRARADVSGNGMVTAYDAALIAQKVVGLREKFPVE